MPVSNIPKTHNPLFVRMAAFDDGCLVTSVHCTPEFLLCVRAVSLVFVTATFVASLVRAKGPTYGEFSSWNAFSTLVYLAAAVFNSFQFVRSDENPSLMNSRHAVIRYLIWLSYVIPAANSLAIFVLFFATSTSQLSGQDALSTWITLGLNAGPFVVMLSELLMNRIPVSFTFIIPYSVYGLLYLGAMFGFHAVQNRWPYELLDTSRDYAAAYYAGVIAAMVVSFLVVALVHQGRDRRRNRFGMVAMQSNFGMGRMARTEAGVVVVVAGSEQASESNTVYL
ncbi:hypothetical protein CcCBS67573_g08062 [Chytriomyces confervae]|uniref:Uncharacterized protein n=1 Tax=Chytriomyces confervae TaxID=246404 RepID=A0A507ENH0_9FUNG|nr:hypothetical protein HDU80_006577 [Chytriomyces hyalinus]TPX65623.1 hypothetical protein CcCBS67573_g08062 [Chytriomyces confervae]